MDIINFKVGDFLKMKKKHPCSQDVFAIKKIGSDVKIVCTGCQRDLIIPREKLEKMIKCVITSDENLEK